VDDPRLFVWAEHLHSVCRLSTEATGSETKADLAWTKSSTTGHDVELGDETWATGMSMEDLFFQSENLLTQIFSRKLQHMLQLHAGAVRSPEGAGWTVIGESQAGKTSMTLALAFLGWHWLTDEVSCIPQEPEFCILPFPRNFNIKEHSWGNFPETADVGFEIFSRPRKMKIRFVDPGELFPGKCLTSAVWKGILMPKYDPLATIPMLNPMAPMACLQLVLPQVLNWTDWGLARLSKAITTLQCIELRYSNPRTAAILFAERQSR